MAVYGIYDYKDKCWLGNSKGPLRYLDGTSLEGFSGHQTAQIAACAMCDRMDIPYDPLDGRFRAREIPNEKMALRDTITPPKSMDEVMESWKQ